MSIGGAARGGVFLFVSSIITYGVGYLYWFLITIFIDPEGVGIASSVLSLGILISGITGLGLPIGVQRFLGREYGRKDVEGLNTYFWSSLVFNLASSVFSAMAIWFLASLGIQFMGFSEIMLTSVGLIVLLSFSPIFEALFVSIVGTEYLAISNLISSIIKLGMGFLLVYFGFGWFGAIMGIVGSSAFLMFFLLIFGLRALRRLGGVKTSLSFRALSRSMHAGFVGWLPMVVALFAQQISILLVFGLRGAFDAGTYFIALTFFNIVRMVPASFLAMALPTLSSIESKGEKILVWKFLKICLAMSCPVVAFVSIYPGLPLSLMGSDYLLAASSLSILCLGIIPLTFIGVINNSVYATGAYRKVLVLGLVVEITRVLSYLILVPVYGGFGAALAFSAGSLPGLGIALYISGHSGFRLPTRKSAVAIIAPFLGGLPCFLLGLSWYISATMILFTSVLCYARLGVIERGDLAEIARGFASEKTIARTGERLNWILRLIYGE